MGEIISAQWRIHVEKSGKETRSPPDRERPGSLPSRITA